MKTELESILGEEIVSPIREGKIVGKSGRSFFLKKRDLSDRYRCEANGLREIAAAGVVRTPVVMAVGSGYLLVGYHENHSPGKDFFHRFGGRLARLHRSIGPEFGFYEDNFIGDNPQPNIASGQEKHHWPAFYFEKRLLYQFRLAVERGVATPFLVKGFGKLENRIESILDGGGNLPSLLHGDLWAGNYLCDPDQQPVLIDPAVYYGDREADLTMTRLFGGFPPSFYEGYRAEWPLPEGWQEREGIYKLYHVLNHLNLFGGGYLHHAEQLLRQYV